jgi:predicted acyl esterase
MRDDDAPIGASSAKRRSRRATVSFAWTIPDDLDIIGPMALRLFVEAHDADDISVFAGVRKYRGGVECTFEGSYGFSGDMVSKGWQRAAHAELDPGLSTAEQPVHTHERFEPLRAGEIRCVHLALRPHATRFRKGDVLRLDLRGAWHYARDPFRGQFPAGYERSRSRAWTVHTGGACDAYLLLGTRPVPVPPSAFVASSSDG